MNINNDIEGFSLSNNNNYTSITQYYNSIKKGNLYSKNINTTPLYFFLEKNSELSIRYKNKQNYYNNVILFARRGDSIHTKIYSKYTNI